MELEDMAKNVDACYKSILDKFNPGSRQLINAGKCYLKALHGAAAAAKVYLDSLSHVAKQAQQGTCGGTADIGMSLQQMVEVQREIQTQQLNTLKAFYIDLIAPLENNIEKDTKVVQADHKKFNQQYKTQFEIYSKTTLAVKKHSKKSSEKKNRSSSSYSKEIKHLQAMEEEKAKLTAFLEVSLREAIIQERKRYGFVLERQTSLSKHFLAHYGKGAALIEKYLDGWQETSRAREDVPGCVEFLLGNPNAKDDNMYTLPRTPEIMLDDVENFCSASQMRKSHSIDTSYLYEESPSFHEAVNSKVHAARSTIRPPHHGTSNLCKSKSEFNLSYVSGPRSARSDRGGFATSGRPKSIALPSSGRIVVKAMYAYLSSGEHQINFLEGDLIQLLGDEPFSFHNSNGDRNKGWYYGENLRTGKRGWFPLAYTEQVRDTDDDSGLGLRSQLDSCPDANSKGRIIVGATTTNGDTESTTSGNSSASNSSGGPLKNVQLRIKASNNKSQAQGRPNSLLTDRALLSRVPGLNKLRKSRSAFAERLLCPATTPAPPTGATINGTTTSATSAPSSALTSCVLSPAKKAPPPPPRHSVPINAPALSLSCHSHPRPPNSNNNLTLFNMTSPTNISLRSSNDSGFVNEITIGPPPAPEIDYSDEDSLKFLDNLSQCLMCERHAKDSSQNSKSNIEENTPDDGAATLALDRTKNGKLPICNGSSYPPVLGYLATLGRSSRNSKWMTFSSMTNGMRKSAGVYTKKMGAKSGSTTLKPSALQSSRSLNSLFRSRSKDSILADQPLSNHTELDSELVYNMWQHKSSVPTYVGWRPPMPLPSKRDIIATEGATIRHRVAKAGGQSAHRLRSNLNWRKFVSESDLLQEIQDSDCEYMAIDPVADPRLPLLPSLPPTLPFLSPVLAQRKIDTAATAKSNYHQLVPSSVLTVPQECVDEPSQAIAHPCHTFSGSLDCLCKSNLLHTTLLHAVQLDVAPTMVNYRKQAPSISFIDYSRRLRQRFQFPEGGSNLDNISETSGNQCGPWYDLWPTSACLDRVYEIAHL